MTNAKARVHRGARQCGRVATRGVSVIATDGGTGTVAAKAETSTIPIVFSGGVDPVKLGLVASLNRPGGNITGATVLAQALVAKRLEVLHQLAPAATSIGFLVNPANPQAAAETKDAASAAGVLGVQLTMLNASTPSEIEKAFETMVTQRIGVLLAAADAVFFAQRDRLAALAARHAVPAIYHAREIVDAGGLMSYGASYADATRLAGSYVGRILKGERPADLPVQQSTKVEFVINMKTAKALGLTVPLPLLGRADEVIE
jgi:putative ABC transport system substrate-binding protein